MAIFGFRSAQIADGDDMAKLAAIDYAIVEDYVAQLIAAGRDRSMFDGVLDSLKEDARVKVGELVAIAVGYTGGGRQPANRTAAISAIGRRFVDLVRSEAKRKTAEKVRVI